jgi:thioredoxin reductase
MIKLGILLSFILYTVAIQQEYCDVVIAGGSTAAVAAALSSAQMGVTTCLLEPTDWPGFLHYF